MQPYIISIVKHLRHFSHLIQVDKITPVTAKPSFIRKKLLPVGNAMLQLIALCLRMTKNSSLVHFNVKNILRLQKMDAII